MLTAQKYSNLAPPDILEQVCALQQSETVPILQFDVG